MPRLPEDESRRPNLVKATMSNYLVMSDVMFIEKLSPSISNLAEIFPEWNVSEGRTSDKNANAAIKANTIFGLVRLYVSQLSGPQKAACAAPPLLASGSVRLSAFAGCNAGAAKIESDLISASES